jgi:tetratricopeptide (TPR) repeat protein
VSVARAEDLRPPDRPPSQAQEAEAKRRFEIGLKLYGEKAYREALGMFAASYRLGGRPPALRNVAQCHRELKEFAEAKTTYERLLQRHGNDLAQADRQAVERAIDELRLIVSERPREPRGRIAVLEFKSRLKGTEREALDAGYFADQVRARVKDQIPSLEVITRENLLVLLEASGKKLDECEGECEVETGRRIGADLVISGELLRIGSNYKLDLRLHDTARGTLLKGAQASGHTAEELDKAIAEAVAAILQPLR